MKTPSHLRYLATSLSIAALVAASAEFAEAAATVNFNSTVMAVNLQSDGTPLDSDFVFQIGTFAGDFEPSAGNTAEWLAHWVPLVDSAADPIPAATTPYQSKELPPPFPPGTVTNGFSGSVEYDHNEPPFQNMGAVYIWGYDNRSSAGPGEWIMVTSSTWGWPSGTSNPPAATFSVGEADTVLIGRINGDGFHMQTAAVTVEEDSAPAGYDGWLAAQFPAGVLADPDSAATVWGVLADPDSDGIANVIEYFTASDPNDPASQRMTSAEVADDHLAFTFFQSKDTTGVIAVIEWSDNLTHWRSDNVAIDSVEDMGEVYKVRASIPLGDGADTFARLNVRRAFE